jgi:hypothetical protein
MTSGYKNPKPSPSSFIHRTTASGGLASNRTALQERGRREEEKRKEVKRRTEGPKPTPSFELTGEEEGVSHLPLHHRSALHGLLSTLR